MFGNEIGAVGNAGLLSTSFDLDFFFFEFVVAAVLYQLMGGCRNGNISHERTTEKKTSQKPNFVCRFRIYSSKFLNFKTNSKIRKKLTLRRKWQIMIFECSLEPSSTPNFCCFSSPFPVTGCCS